MKKKDDQHAFLIMISKIDEQFFKLINALLYESNDIFVHLDKKAKVPTNENLIFFKKNQIHFFQEIEVNWAGYSQVRTELFLLGKATHNKTKYKYIHLLSGSDLPIISNQKIHKFLREKNEEFVEIQEINQESSMKRIRYFYLLQECIGKHHGILWALQKCLVLIQKLIGVNRISSNSLKIAKGSNWFSITEDFANFIFQKKEFIKMLFKTGQAVDEMFVQTLLINSKFKKNCADPKCGNLRYIVWGKKNSPKILKSQEDYISIEASNKLFARKFDEKVNKVIINKVLSKAKDL
ncbi:beta-1,6-N-acetylglucosaminyltransferase [Pediococcus ethanolidurans]|uniref:Peptide O-xylosyltransferase n=1 Tax=Pediococcus ethanolidurans TaxID=319653 RepID=A0A0R2JWF9_9LACO|nr:beta-1,6-N-acetylglucosaminyltransferase [Pediococcus ethanolidurans]KRN81473.1 glycosyl transferase family 14 [Pediococcus ethanolidurans]GEN95254.1 glycosyl transferase [Pediococcus ethanolidurans]SER60885.1 Core-2/I-Branching enzyme [Pediococcus ethanolidurans]